MIYICTPIASHERTPEEVSRRVEELKERLAQHGYEGISHLDTDVDGKWADKVGANIALILSADGILLDYNRRISRVCMLEETIAKTIPSWKRHFIFLHTYEEYDKIKSSFVV